MKTIPTVYCLVPVYNRIDVTIKFLEYIKTQDYPDIRVIVIDDGSTDGTGEYLAKITEPTLTVLHGNGNLWWSGAMKSGIDYVSRVANRSDYLLMINNDVAINVNYVSELVKASLENGNSIIGSSQRDEVTKTFLGSGYLIDYKSMRFIAVDCNDDDLVVDSLPGRGALFPMIAIFQVGNIYAKLFPHYLADIEFVARCGERGWKIMVSHSATVFTSSESSDVKMRNIGFIPKYFSFKSRANILGNILFFTIHGPILLRIFAIPRYFISRVPKR